MGSRMANASDQLAVVHADDAPSHNGAVISSDRATNADEPEAAPARRAVRRPGARASGEAATDVRSDGDEAASPAPFRRRGPHMHAIDL